jgi:hypothetical protein
MTDLLARSALRSMTVEEITNYLQERTGMTVRVFEPGLVIHALKPNKEVVEISGRYEVELTLTSLDHDRIISQDMHFGGRMIHGLRIINGINGDQDIMSFDIGATERQPREWAKRLLALEPGS